jgi:hypothetical protein
MSKEFAIICIRNEYCAAKMKNNKIEDAIAEIFVIVSELEYLNEKMYE